MKAPAQPSAHILVVDDDSIVRNYLAASLRMHSHTVTQAESAAAARRLIQGMGTAVFDAVVTDFWMPEETGLSLLAWIRRLDPCLAGIIVTAEGEKQLIADSLHQGVYDFHEKPVSVAPFAASVCSAVRHTLRQRALRAAESAIRDVAYLQRALTRIHSPQLKDRVDVCFFPKQEVGGDFASVFPVGEHQFLVIATDVSGHDLRAAFAASYFQGVVRGMMEQRARIEEVFTFFNSLLLRNWDPSENAGQGTTVDISLAACAILVDTETQTARVINCGFPIPFYCGKQKTHLLLDQGSSPLGWFPDTDLRVTVVPIVDGGTITLWSDGVEDLAASLGVDPHGLTLALRRSIAAGHRHPEFLRGARDDIMSIVVRTDVDPSTSINEEILLRQTVRGNTEAQINDYQEFWARTLNLALPDLPESIRYAILLCTREAVLNALKHGCKGNANHAALLEMSVQQDSSRVQVYISDPGDGHVFDLDDYEQQASADMLTEHRGLILISHLCDQLISERNGAELTLVFNLNPEFVSDLPSHASALQSRT